MIYMSEPICQYFEPHIISNNKAINSTLFYNQSHLNVFIMFVHSAMYCVQHSFNNNKYYIKNFVDDILLIIFYNK